MEAPPVVSVVMIFLDAQRFMVEAIESVLAQSYPHWELLLVNDGSMDRSESIARGYVDQEPARIRCLAHSGGVNRGMSASRNLGAQHARGQYLAFLDADDVYLPEKLERQVALLQAYPRAAMVYGASQHWYSWTDDPAARGRDRLRKLGVTPETLVEPPGLVLRFLRREAWTPGTCSVLIRRHAFERVQGFEEVFWGMYEDQAFFYKLCLTEPVYVEGGTWDRYRQHADSWCERAMRLGDYTSSREPSPATGAFLVWLERYFRDHGVNDLQLRAHLRKALWPYRHPVLYHLSRMMRRAGAGRP